MTYYDWAKDQPDNFVGQNCLYIDVGFTGLSLSKTTGIWGAHRCDYHLSCYACEYTPPAPPPGTIDPLPDGTKQNIKQIKLCILQIVLID